MDFFTKLNGAVERHQSLLCVGLDPQPDQMPTRYRHDDGLLPSLLNWHRALIAETADLVCAYKPNIAFYEALGLDGCALLQETLALIPPEVPVILDAKRGDIGNTAAAYARACFEVWQADAVTLSPYLGWESIAPFAAYSAKGLFVLCHTSNPGAAEFQELQICSLAASGESGALATTPLYVQVAATATGWSPAVCLVVGATYPQALAAARQVAPLTWILVPGIGAQGGDLAATLQAGLRGDGRGLIVSASRAVAAAPDPRAAAAALRQEIEEERQRLMAAPSAAAPTAVPIAAPRTAALSPTERRELLQGLAALGALKFGSFTLASGSQSPFYIDLRLLVSRPQLLAMAARAYAALLAGLPCDRLAGVPYAALPIGTAVALATDLPLIYPRKEAKAHGLGRELEGAWQPGERAVIVEDLITSGGNILSTATRLRAAGLVVTDALVLIDRQQGGAANLAAAGIQVHSVFQLSEILDTLTESGQLDAAKRDEVVAFVQAAAGDHG